MSLQAFRDNGQIPGITYTILTELIKRKQKKNIWKRREAAASLSLIACCGSLILYVFFFHPESLSSMKGFHTLISRPGVLLILFLSVLFIIVFIFCRGEREDAEDDFDDLRDEVIDRADELWPKEQVDFKGDTARYVIMNYLKKNFDINLFYK
jgi:hypothetical protein